MNKFLKEFKERGYFYQCTNENELSKILDKSREEMQAKNLGYLAVSLGFYKTLFSAPSLSTSSEIDEKKRKKMGLTNSLVRISIGLDHDIERTYIKIKECIKKIKIL